MFIDPILWLPGGIPRLYPYHPSQIFSRTHSIECLHMHHRLQMPRMLNQLPTKKAKMLTGCGSFSIMKRRPPDPPSEPSALLVRQLLN
ncbi:uncharacterized protein BX663DRAFT_500591 [Cokeromyces recurvatus]|uniref:uncharacterized protein n=1 Tax=Cokeromyces recurvatus TaxID=90255 RepID=UPI00221E5C3D|nr:uncharacterized protein BX663DRAFT_500591 [Cokeromyces recurvatus]KAI7905692.1 hypothetical protein BX663DRAFT_500591 [Cokeromyces recurvatus]